MKKIFLILFIFTIFLTACNTPTTQDADYFVDFSNDSIVLNSYESQKLVFDTNADLNLINFQSSNEAIVKIIDGNAVPVSSGTATIKANINGVEHDNMAIVVIDDGARPFLNLENNYIALFEGMVYGLNPTITLRGKNIEGTYSYSSSDDSVVTVDGDGNITAKGKGVADVTISANYGGFDSNVINSLERTIHVAVQPEVVLFISSGVQNISNVNLEIGDASYSNSTSIEGFAYYDGEYNDITEEDVQWVVEKSNVVTINNGQIIGNGVGNTKIHAKLMIDGVEYQSNSIEIFVEKPLVNIDNDPLDIDLFVNEIDIDNSFMMNDDEDVLNIYDYTNPYQSIYDGEKLVDYNDIGPRKWIVESTTLRYVINIIACSKIITNATEMSLLHTYAKDVVKESSGIVSFDGYYVLASDIDMELARLKNICGITTGAISPSNDGFVGTFDGRGYTISNVEVAATNGGLFGTVNKNGVVKNVAFKNVIISGNSGLISSNFGGTIDNVYVEGSVTSQRATAETPASLLVSKICSGAKISNCIVKLSNPEANLAFCSAIGMYYSTNEDSLQNVYVLGTNTKVLSTKTSGAYDVLNNTNNGQFVNYSDLLTKDLSSFNDYWNFDESGIEFSAF